MTKPKRRSWVFLAAGLGLFAAASSAYVLMGVKWPQGTDMIYTVNLSSAQVSGQLGAVTGAASSWNALNPSAFRMTYGGATTVVGEFFDGANTISWQDQGASATLATTYTWFFPGDPTIIENDIVFNDAQPWSISGGDYDVQTVALHEMGHVVGLDHSDTGIMQAYYGGIQRSIDADARAGFYAMYGAPAGGSPSGHPPSVAITSPAAGAFVSGIVPLAATATGYHGLNRVEFIVNSTLLARVTAAPYRASWDTSSILNGPYPVRAIAYDTVGQTAEDQVNVILLPHAPIDFAGTKRNNSSTLLQQYINVLSWQAHPANHDIQSYRLYRQDGPTWTLIAEFDAQTFSAMDKNVDPARTYTYNLKAVDAGGREGDAAARQVRQP
jgi:hypothetical protein